MRSRVIGSINLVRFAAVAVAAISLACAHASRPSAQPRSAAAPAIDTFYRLASSGAHAATVYEAHTLSVALDRIDQRTLPLDQTYRHPGTGKGVTVYVFDGGISTTHPELAGRVRVGYSGFPGDPAICNPHGTAVAGAIAGSTLGVAPQAEIVDVKMVQCERLRGTIQAIVDGARWVIQDHAQHPGPAVANWSFIADTAARIPALDSAVTALRDVGIPVVVSAGNLDIDACRVSPANSKGTIVVGAASVHTERGSDGLTRIIDRRAPNTAYGSCIDIYAPGDSVLLPSLDRNLGAISQLWNGTSMAAGYVSGAAALYLEAHPTATPDEVAEQLERSSTLNVLRDTRATISRMLYVGTGETRVIASVDFRRR
ncbi:MAG TPA: S8 family peptidase [Gemmatimonadaceae bacterium]|jgi:subtilisin family serine protease|nr:S8 family peptidase [Gemmatimonadaceae bacterium]